MSLGEAQELIVAATAHAAELAVNIAAVVLDPAGRLVAAARMDGAPLMAVDMATGKAYTAAGMGAPTEVWEEATKADAGFGGAITSVPGFTPFGGGKPLTDAGVLVGAIGISGGTVEQDVEIAQAALDAH
ncbi:GlcG/HbpS family heme-binding protein [Nocardioides sp. GXZ039]|uniref:GlcG/HbpS family heme-binding protein n=1 Tax=Nocardioides sp. GXZ039 TaxID=3136018 RepID=UPI0030F46202